MTETTDSTEAPALPGDGLREAIVDDLRRHIGDGLIEFVLKPQDDLWVRVAANTWADSGRALRAMGFEYFCFLSAIDWKPSPYGRGEDDPTQPPPERKTAVVQGYAGGETRFQVLARVTDIRRHVGVTLKADVPSEHEGDDGPSIDSWHAIYAGANWHERETHEMFGIAFNGHPDLRNMYLPTEFEGYPLRKDFPLLARMVKPWPGIVDVEPMPADDADGDGVADATPAPAEGTPEAAPETAADPSTVTSETADDAPAHETPTEDVAAAEAAEAPDTVVAEEIAADVAPVAEEAAADVPAEPEGEVETVTGTADEVEATADAAADETREADETAAENAGGGDAAGSGEVAVGEEALERGADESADGSEALSSAKTADADHSADQSDDGPVAAAGIASLPEPTTEESEQPAASPAPATGPTNTEAGPYAGSLVAPADGAMPAGFEIKGNGQSMLFHVPGSRYYNATKPEYWFDTEENARAAGFTKPGEGKGADA